MRYNSTLKSLLRKKTLQKREKRERSRGKPQKTFQLPHPISCVITEARSRPRFIPHPEHERERERESWRGHQTSPPSLPPVSRTRWYRGLAWVTRPAICNYGDVTPVLRNVSYSWPSWLPVEGRWFSPWINPERTSVSRKLNRPRGRSRPLCPVAIAQADLFRRPLFYPRHVYSMNETGRSIPAIHPSR